MINHICLTESNVFNAGKPNVSHNIKMSAMKTKSLAFQGTKQLGTETMAENQTADMPMNLIP
jgi:hypothetical protein